MSVTSWEYRRSLSNQVRGVWDVHTTYISPSSWEPAFEVAREQTAARLDRDAKLIREMSFDEFQRFQGMA